VRQHDRFWAGYLGLTPPDWNEPGLSIRVRLAHQLGYRRYATHLAVRLETEDPRS
jgi:hypothetical protein